MDWTEKYRPDSLSDIYGHDGEISQLISWAENWPEEGKVAILHGPPGLGKTSTAHALADDMEWGKIEMNASESRTKDVVERVAGGAATNGTLTGGAAGKRLVILDEADSLHGNKDRGGSRAITQIANETSQPVILIANDFYEVSRSLRNDALDLEFEPVDDHTLRTLLETICATEQVEYADSSVQTIVNQNDGDIRGAINDLEAAAANADGEMTEDDIVTEERNRTKKIFPFLSSLLQECSPQDARQLAYNVDESPKDLINWIEENVVKEYTPRELRDAYTQLARGDEWLGRVHQTQNYSYWKYATESISSGVAAARQGRNSGWTRYSPPTFWQKLGRSKGMRNKRDHIAKQIADTSGVSMATSIQEIMPLLSVATHHCKNRELTVVVAAAYDLEEEHISYLTGSGEDTNKVGSIVEDAQQLQESQISKIDSESDGGESHQKQAQIGNSDMFAETSHQPDSTGTVTIGGNGTQNSGATETDSGETDNSQEPSSGEGKSATVNESEKESNQSGLDQWT